MYTPADSEFVSFDNYTFWIDKKDLVETGKLVAESKNTVNIELHQNG